MLCRFAHSCYFNTEKAKEAAETFFTMRRDYPHIYTDRDPRALHMQRFISGINIAHLDLSAQRKLFLWQLKDPSLEHYDFTLDAKFHLLVNDCWFLANEERFYENDIHMVADFKNLVSFKMVFKLNMLTARILAKYQREAVPIRLKQLHFVNASYMSKKVFSVLKPLFSKETVNLIHFHEPNSDTLFDFFSKDELPSDYGGTRPSMETLMAETMKLLEEKRDIVLKEEFWVVKSS
ncbi:alpha-tocopherol transfer protein-like isoform X2 [Aricia agestis]|nr:alpha-tocopherol transfer protein-like isoform X2 [Aricia agestis]